MTGKALIIEMSAVAFCLLTAMACTRVEDAPALLTLHLDTCPEYSKSMMDPDEDKLSDANVYIFNDASLLEKHLWIRFPQDGGTISSVSVSDRTFSVEAVAGERYSVYALCNAGFRLPDMSETQLAEYKYYMSRPDAYSQGIPMAGVQKGIVAGNGAEVDITMERLMSKISLKIDRSRLRKDVELFVHTVKIGNCPRCVQPFSPSPVSGREETFAAGFCKFGDECFDLNHIGGNAMSDEVALYLLENPAEAVDSLTSPYVELQMDYLSDSWYSNGGEGLVYRFYIRENDSYRIERNCHYKVCVTPHEDGLLTEDSWRVDKSELFPSGQQFRMSIIPEGSWVDGIFYRYYYEMPTNSTAHFDVITFPEGIPVTLRGDLVADELEDGRAEYILDPDGRGFTVRSLEKNCLSMMEIIPSCPHGEDYAETVAIGISSPI